MTEFRSTRPTYIAHRGNVSGPKPSLENHPTYVDEAISHGFDAEVDVWIEEGEIFLGHDSPRHKVEMEWIFKRQSSLWLHLKNELAIETFFGSQLHWFVHDQDSFALTSKGVIWAFPGNTLTCAPYVHLDFGRVPPNLRPNLIGICGDYVQAWVKE